MSCWIASTRPRRVGPGLVQDQLPAPSGVRTGEAGASAEVVALNAQEVGRPTALLAWVESLPWNLVLQGEVWVGLVVGACAALLVAALGLALPPLETESENGPPIERRTIESNFGEPFVVCTTQDGITRCKEVDLRGDRA